MNTKTMRDNVHAKARELFGLMANFEGFSDAVNELVDYALVQQAPEKQEPSFSVFISEDETTARYKLGVYTGRADCLPLGHHDLYTAPPAPAAVPDDWRERLIANYRAQYAGQSIESWIRGLPDSLIAAPQPAETGK